MSYLKQIKNITALTLLVSSLASQAKSDEQPIKVKVFVGTMFEIGKNTGDKAGEFQHWYERYFTKSQPINVKGALTPVYCNDDGVCGSVLGMGKVASSASVQAIILSPKFDMSQAYFILSGVAGTPPTQGTIGDVNWASWLVDYDLGHRWAPEEGEKGAATFMPRKGYEKIRVYHLNPDLTAWAMKMTAHTPLKDADAAKSYRARYSQEAARRSPSVTSGTHVTGDTFFHGPGLSAEAQYIAKLYGADDYMMTEMEATAIAQVIERSYGTQRIMSLRGAVNFDRGSDNETTLQHLDPAPGQTAGGFAETVDNITAVGATLVDYIVANWDQWQNGVPPLPAK